MKNISILIVMLFITVSSVLAKHETDTLFLAGSFDEGEIMLNFKTIEILEDQSNKLQIEDIISNKFSNLFFTNEEIKQTNTNINSSYWVRFYTRNLSTENSYLIDIHSPNASKLTHYSIDHKGNIHCDGSTGINVAFSKREFKDKNLLLNMRIGDKNDLITHYVKVDKGGYCRFNFCLSSYPYFIYFSKIEFLLLGMFYGIIVVMMIYNLIMFLTMRDFVYLFYIGLLFCSSLRTMSEDRMGGLFLWQNYPELSYYMGIYIAPHLVIIMYILFTISFLKLKWSNKLSKSIVYSWLFYFVSNISLLIVYGDIPNVSIFYSIPFAVILVVAFLLNRKKRDISWYYLIGVTVFLFTIILSELRHHKMIFGGVWVVFSYHISLVFQSLLFSFSIFDRLKIMQANRERLLKNAQEQDKLHYANLKKIQYWKTMTESLRSQLQMILLPVNRLINTVPINSTTAHDLNTFKKQSEMFFELSTRADESIVLSQPSNSISKNNIIEFARNISNSFTDLASSKNIKIDFISATSQFECYFEHVIYEKIVFNLLLNAINQSSNYEKIRFRINIFEENSKIQFEVEDSGGGLSDDEIEIILNNNIQDKAYDIYKIGFGLEFIAYLSKKINGTLHIESELHKGTLILVDLPFNKDLKANIEEVVTDVNPIITIENNIPDFINNQIINEINTETELEVKEEETEVFDKYFEQFISNAFKFVEERISDPELDVDDLCRGLGVSRAQLYRKFKSYKQLTVKEFVKEVRLKKAASLLLESNLNVNEIMMEVGFQNRQYFAKCFKEQFDETPSNYKSKMKAMV